LQLSSSKGEVVADGADSAQIKVDGVFTGFANKQFTPDEITISVAPAGVGACSEPADSSFTFVADAQLRARAAVSVAPVEDARTATITVSAKVTGDDGVAQLSASIALAIRAPAPTDPVRGETKSKETDEDDSSEKEPLQAEPFNWAVPEGLRKIIDVAENSDLADHVWEMGKRRERAPSGYLKGMALTYARAYCRLKAGDGVATEMAKPVDVQPYEEGDTDVDALSRYNDSFVKLGMSNNTSRDRLRHLFVLMIGHGMYESSGRYCEGRDASAKRSKHGPHEGEKAEAGPFQTSYNIMSASPMLDFLYTQYKLNPSGGFLDVFKEGVKPTLDDSTNYGTRPGVEFQRFSKECPAFATELAAVGLRNKADHWGPVINHKAEVRPECDAMLSQVENVVDRTPGICTALALVLRDLPDSSAVG